MKAAAIALAAGAAMILAGCAIVGTQRATTDGVNFTEMSPAEAQTVPRCAWRACVLAEPGQYADSINDMLKNAFASSVVSADMGGGRVCDVGFRYESLAWGTHSDVLSAYTGEKLLHLDANALDGARLACALLTPGKPLGDLLIKQRDKANGVPDAQPVETAERPEKTAPAAGQAKPWWQN